MVGIGVGLWALAKTTKPALWKAPTNGRTFRHPMAAFDEIMAAKRSAFLHRLSAFADFLYGMTGLAVTG
jgi:hypothetical protein